MSNIEIINGVPVNWNKYKGNNSNVSKNGYIALCEKLYEKGDNLLSEYTSAKDKIIIDFNCEHEPHLITPNNYKNGRSCKYCANINRNKNKMLKAKKDFLEQLENNNHILLSEYINTDTKVLIDFNCEHEPHLITPEKYKRGDRCPNCVGKNGQAKKDFMSLLDKNKHYLIGEYINNSTKVLIDFNCGHEPHLTSPSKYKAGQRCPKCANENRNNLSIEKARIDFLQVIKSNNHILKSEYINSSTKVLIDFKCGHNPHWITPNDYKLYKGCPYCKNKGEGALYNLLLETFEEVETQKTFDNLKDKKLLSYDFYLPTYNLLIELDGVHHREIVTYGKDYESSKDRFEDRIKKDKLKNEYAKNNNIHLLRIEYNSKIELDKWKQLILDKINEIETNSVA